MKHLMWFLLLAIFISSFRSEKVMATCPGLAEQLRALIQTGREAGGYLRQDVRLAATQGHAGNLHNHIYKKTQALKSSVNLSEKFTGFIQGIFVTKNAGQAERFYHIKALNISEIIIAPGHNFIRSPQNIQSLSEYIGTHGSGGDFQHDRLILNIITNSDGEIKAIDTWNGHHRLVAYLNLGMTTIEGIGAHNLDILVNGHRGEHELLAHWLPAHGVDLNVFRSYSHVPDGDDAFTLSFDGRLSNYQIGSRSTIGQLFHNLKLKKRKIGIYFGTFDPIHEGHIRTAQAAQNEFGLDEVVFVPNIKPLHKPNVLAADHRLNMLAVRLKREKGLNFYIGDSSISIDLFGNAPLVRRIGQLYGTDQVFQIQGPDAMGTLMAYNQVSPKSYSKYIVLPRDEGSRNFYIPDNLKGTIFFMDQLVERGVSSGLIRDKIQSGASTRRLLAPAVREYIDSFKLYQ